MLDDKKTKELKYLETTISLDLNVEKQVVYRAFITSSTISSHFIIGSKGFRGKDYKANR